MRGWFLLIARAYLFFTGGVTLFLIGLFVKEIMETRTIDWDFWKGNKTFQPWVFPICALIGLFALIWGLGH